MLTGVITVDVKSGVFSLTEQSNSTQTRSYGLGPRHQMIFCKVALGGHGHLCRGAGRADSQPFFRIREDVSCEPAEPGEEDRGVRDYGHTGRGGRST